MKIQVIYHKADYDGIFCREIARQFLGDAITYTGWDYGDKVPLMAPDLEQLYMLDISIPELMDHPRLIWIDHHKSAIEKYLPKVIPGYRIDGVAACRLAWQWFSHELHAGNAGDMGLIPDKDDFVKRVVDEPLSVRLAGEYDIWDHSKSNYADVAFQFGLDCQSEINWKLLFNADVHPDGPGEREAWRIVGDGHIAQHCYAKRDADVMRERSFLAEFEGLKFLCLNTPRCNSNTFAARDVPETGHDALLAFYFNGKENTFSLYHAAHRKDLDLSLIAVKYGGGGHRGACGFRSNFIPASFQPL